jgi:hypothetical protein
VTSRPRGAAHLARRGLAAFFGTFALRATRFVGAATLVGIVALGIRGALVSAFDAQAVSVSPWLLALPPLVALDLVYAFRLAAGRSAPGALVAAAASTVGLVGMVPWIAALYVYPRVTLETVPLMVAMGGVTALWACFLGGRLGERFRPVAAEADVAVPRGAWRAPAVALGVAVTFMVWFIATATPPV